MCNVYGLWVNYITLEMDISDLEILKRKRARGLKDKLTEHSSTSLHCNGFSLR